MSIIPEMNKVHKSWKGFFTSDMVEQLKEIEKKISKTPFVPHEDNVLRFLGQDLSTVKCIWLGQDPYYEMYGPNNYVANGRSFQPNNLHNWGDTFNQKALQNIVRLVYKNHNNITNYDDIPKYTEIRSLINTGAFSIKQPQEWFDSLERQGVLFLNRYLTTEQGKNKGNKHRKYWKDFSVNLIKYICEVNPNIVWLLWGNEACSVVNYMTEDISTIQCNHPTYCSIKKSNDFLKSDCFKKINSINWLG